MFFVVFHPVPLEKGHIFLLKRFGLMMRRLLGDVFLYRFTIGYTHGEGGISRLPTEILDADGLVNPPRGRLFDVLDERSQGISRPKADQQMNMIGDAADGFGNSVRGMNQSAEVFVQAIPP